MTEEFRFWLSKKGKHNQSYEKIIQSMIPEKTIKSFWVSKNKKSKIKHDKHKS